MIAITLIVFPGGFEDVKEVPAGWTVEQAVASFALADRGICLNGRDLSKNEQASTVLSAGDTVAALAPQKGN
jgi:molybdopterin converting factor small subunit